MKFLLDKKRLDLKVLWKISRNESTYKENFYITLRTDVGDFLGEVAPNVRYGENEEVIRDNFEKLSLMDVENIDYHVFCHSFRYGVESAVLRYKAFTSGKSIPHYLDLKENKRVLTSFSIPIMELEKIKDYVQELKRFKFLKLKINKENARSLTSETLKWMGQDQILRVDGNEAFLNKEECLAYLNEFRAERIEFIEQPMPSSMFNDYIWLKERSPFPLMADESIETEGDFNTLKKGFNYINVKLMKAGGLVNAKRLLVEARKSGLKTMLGCMIESSLGIRDALYLSSLADAFDLDGSLLIKEDPFNYISEENGEIFY